MILKIYHNKNVRKAKLTSIRLSKNKKYLIWEFTDAENRNVYRGITYSKIIYGRKAYIWYSSLAGYFLPHSYTINLNSIIGKECFIVLDNKQLVAYLVPIYKQHGDINRDEDIFK